MGSVCCIAARDKTLPNRSVTQSSHRNIRYSPSWSSRWDSGAHIEDDLANPVRFSVDNPRNRGSEFKGKLEAETEVYSDIGSPVENFQTPTWQKSPVCEESTGDFKAGALDLSLRSNFSSGDKGFAKSSKLGFASDPKHLVSTASISSSMSKAEPSSSHSHKFATDSRARRSPGYQQSSTDLTMGSHGDYSDGWSMRTFSELVASQRERWSFDSENTSSGLSKISKSNSQLLISPPVDLQTCGICSKLLTERSSWHSNDLSVVAVLACGHVFHAECLEHSTPETARYDPSCPVCTAGEKLTSKMSKKASKSAVDVKARNKISRVAIVDSDLDGEAVLSQRNSGWRDDIGPKMGASSSVRSSFGRPFLRRHFSMGSKSVWSLSENDSTRRKGFWARYRRE